MNLIQKCYRGYKDWKRQVYKCKLWNIGFLHYDDDSIFKPFEIKWLNLHGHRDSWFADPFILSHNGNKLEVLVEEMMLKRTPEMIMAQEFECKGKISKLEIEFENGEYVLKRVVPVIEGELHYSFPVIYRKDGETYIHPENRESGKSTLFKYDLSVGKAVPVETLCNAPLTDAVIFDGFGEPMIFATRRDEWDKCRDELGVYRSKTGSWKGPYENVPFTKIKFPDNSAREAGYFIKLKDGRTIRVAQDCNGKYGAGLVFYSMQYFSDEKRFAFKEVARHFPNSPLWHMGMHTFNVFGDLAVVDGYGYTHPVKRTIYRTKEKIKGLFRKKSPITF